MDKLEKDFKKTTIWIYQYKPLINKLRCGLNSEALKKFNELSFLSKITLIDNLKSKGML